MLTLTYRYCTVTEHTVSVFHLYTSHKFLKIKCTNCKNKDLCSDTKHKREICVVAKKATEALKKYTHGRVSSFASDEFYVCVDKNRDKKNLGNIIHKIKMEYFNNVR